MKFNEIIETALRYQVFNPKEVFEMISDLAKDYDGNETIDGLKELIDELRMLANLGKEMIKAEH